MEGDVKVCEYCKRSVACAHFALHEAHCLRFLVICPECGEPIPESKMEEHFENSHKEVERAKCRQNMQKHLLEVHETKECQMRQVKCKFCELAMDFSKQEIHEYHCGSRTELCPDCNQYILLRELASHKDACQGEQAQPSKGERMSAPVGKINCNSCNQMIPINKYAHHMDECCPVSEFAKLSPFEKPRNAPLSLPSLFAVDQTSTAQKDVRPKTKSINRFPLLSENSTKKAPTGKKKPLDLPLTSELKPRTTSPTGDEATYDILRKCSRCDILLPLPILNRHQEKCRWLASRKGKYMRNFS
ncbi:XIAP-associated factor 1 isoform X1 [Trichechus manatus latirostris]|uniref:XIAP-associated factor 1 isoform X1 n=1 Tax=Trichechus manatus latirostris TaxID=127582 RepID=A0A2Y9DK69_TRIMA|nr:XIAP-associated factor 1 isoform X1 [Trichechus manatus latirostris]